MVKSLTILGATGSIGDSTLDLVRAHKDQFRLVALTANSNVEKLAALAIEFEPDYVAIADASLEQELREKLASAPIKTRILAGAEALVEAASMPCDITMAAIVGMAGLSATMAAIRQGNIVAFASKECLVAAGTLMMREVKRCGTTLLPVDSEHNAIYQVFDNENRPDIIRLILTASGGPFRTWPADQMANATPQQAVNHPTWSMGAKISVDSATLMNKALEVIEAHYLFDMDEAMIDVIVHPQSLIHSMVEYCDGSILSQMGPSDMRTPIAYCLGWPKRLTTSGHRLDLTSIEKLTFEEPDLERFSSLSLVRDVLRAETHHAVIFNAANEVAVAAFLSGDITFGEIMPVIEMSLDFCDSMALQSIEDVISYDSYIRGVTQSIIQTKLKYGRLTAKPAHISDAQKTA